MVVSGLAAVLVLLATIDFSRQSLGSATAIPILAAAAAGSLWIIATHLDSATPSAPMSQAFLRLLVPFFVIAGFAWWAMNQAIFEHTALGWFLTIPAVAALLGSAYLVTRFGQGASTKPAGSSSVDSLPAASNDSVESGRPLVHTVTSVLITVGWLPLGFFVLFFANWCTPRGEDTKVLVLSLLFVGAQLVGNLVAGPLLDRRFGAGCAWVERCSRASPSSSSASPFGPDWMPSSGRTAPTHIAATRHTPLDTWGLSPTVQNESCPGLWAGAAHSIGIGSLALRLKQGVGEVDFEVSGVGDELELRRVGWVHDWILEHLSVDELGRGTVRAGVEVPVR